MLDSFANILPAKILSVLFQVEYNDPESDWKAASPASTKASKYFYCHCIGHDVYRHPNISNSIQTLN